MPLRDRESSDSRPQSSTHKRYEFHLLLPVYHRVFVAAAIYYFITRDTEQYRSAVDKRLKEIAHERGGVTGASCSCSKKSC
jgi:hypothetical protein